MATNLSTTATCSTTRPTRSTSATRSSSPSSATTRSCKRSLGFFSTFAIAFSFISATNGFYALFYYGLDIGGPAGLIWQWPIIVFGQFMVALVFAEAASHYPLAGGVYQWAKRFMGGTYGWFVAWMFAAALLVTVAAVAFGVAPIVCSLMGWDVEQLDDAALDRRRASPWGR